MAPARVARVDYRDDGASRRLMARRRRARRVGLRGAPSAASRRVRRAPPPLDAARCAPGERAGSIRAWWREREQMLAPDRSVTLSVPSGQGFVVARLQIVAPDCSVTLIFPSGQPVVLRRRLGPRAAAPASGAPATTTESSSVAARDRRRRAHHPIDAASRGSLPSRAAPIILATTSGTGFACGVFCTGSHHARTRTRGLLASVCKTLGSRWLRQAIAYARPHGHQYHQETCVFASVLRTYAQEVSALTPDGRREMLTGRTLTET